MSAPVMSSGAILDLWEMLPLLASRLVACTANVNMFADRFTTWLRDGEKAVSFRLTALNQLVVSIKEIEKTATELELPATRGAAERSLQALADVSISGGMVAMDSNGLNAAAQSLGQIHTAFIDELRARPVFTLPSAALLAQQTPPFGTGVESAFPLAAEDIGEATQCLAFGRYTATVFHLMRAMELAVQALASHVGITNVDRVWGQLLSDIEAAIKQIPDKAKRDQWSASHVHLYHVKQAWRNDTMHPKQTYTEEQATEVYRAVRSFMTHLADLVT